MQQDINSVVKWSHDNGIILNAQKTKIIIIRSPHYNIPDLSNFYRPITHSYTCFHNPGNCKCEPIEIVPCVTYLGVKIDQHFSWSNHIDYICGKLRILLGKFYYLKFKVPQKVLKCLYMTMVDSVVSYALDSYGLTFKSYIQKIETLQIKFLKLLVNNKTKHKCKGNYYQLFKICKILPASLKHKLLLFSNNYGCREHLTPVHHGHSTRAISEGKYVVPRINNYYGDRCLKKRIPYLANQLPSEVAEAQYKRYSIKLFKKHLLSNINL